MNFISQFSIKKKVSPYILESRIPNTFILPYVNGKLNFSQMVNRAFKKIAFDQVLIDVPYFLGNSEWIDELISIFPFLASLYIKKDNEHYFYSYTPNNPAVAAMILARKNKINYLCIDDPKLLFCPTNSIFSPTCNLKDDQLIFTDGLDVYFKDEWKHLESLWWLGTKIDKNKSVQRANYLVKQLKEINSQNKKVFFVCEFRLWWLIKVILDGKFQVNDIDENHEWQDLTGAFAIEEPAVLWIKGQLDDYPYVSYKFYENLIKKEQVFSSKLEILDQIFSDYFKDVIESKKQQLSIRQLINFKRYLTQLLLISNRWSPNPIKHLLPAIKSCFKEGTSTNLIKKILSFPYPPLPGDVKSYSFVEINSSGIMESDDYYDLPDLFNAKPYFPGDLSISEIEKRKYWMNNITNYSIRSHDRGFFNERVDNTWTTSTDKKIQYLTNAFIINSFNKNSMTFRRKISYGSLKNGIDWKSTIREFSGENNRIAVREKKEKPPLSKYCPVVYIFSRETNNETYGTVHEGNITGKLLSLGFNPTKKQGYPQEDYIYTIFRSISKTEFFLKGHLRIENLSSMAINFTSKYLWFERYKELTKREKKYLCRHYPIDESDFQKLSLQENIIVWGIKYAKDTILILAYPGWKPSKNILEFSSYRNIKILQKPLSILPVEYIKRLKINCYVSNALKKHPQCDEIVDRHKNAYISNI